MKLARFQFSIEPYYHRNPELNTLIFEITDFDGQKLSYQHMIPDRDEESLLDYCFRTTLIELKKMITERNKPPVGKEPQ